MRVFKRDKKSDIDIRQQFYSRKQKVNESESEFLTNLWLLVQEANPVVNLRDGMDYAGAAVFAYNIGNEVLRDKLSVGLEEGRYNSTSELLDAATKHSSSCIRNKNSNLDESGIGLQESFSTRNSNMAHYNSLPVFQRSQLDSTLRSN